jgi:heat shock protein HtpX
MPSAPSMARRAAVAVLLLIGFYGMAIGIAAVLLLIAYFVGSGSLGHVSFGGAKIVFLCLAGAGIIIWSILPRFDRFQAPGPRLKLDEQPELFGMITSLSETTGEAMPEGVYLLTEVNAWVAQRGGLMGLGSRRVMGLGLPLMDILSIAQLRAVLAHEFGHYYGGDTRLGPIIYNMRRAIGRTIFNLARRNSALHKPFLWYGEGALRITQGASRQQEHAADELAARTVGARALADALKRIHAAAISYEAYLQQEVYPLFSLNVRPAFAAGFAKFMAAPPIEKIVATETEREIAEGKSDPYDSHPPLRDRLAELARMPHGEIDSEAELASSLLRNLNGLEADLLVFATGKPELRTWRNVGWERVGEEVYLPNWKKVATEHAAGLKGAKPTDLPNIASDLFAFGQRFVPKTELPSRDVIVHRAQGAVSSAFAIALHEHGWKLQNNLGEPIRFTLGDKQIEPFNVVRKLESGELTKDAWEKECEESNLADWDLGAIENLAS